MRKNIEQMIPEVWKVFRSNLVVFVPPVFVFVVYSIVTVSFIVMFFLSISLKISGLTGFFTDFRVEELKSLLTQVTAYSIVMLIIFGILMLIISVIHAAGWGNMFACAAVNGTTNLGDYFDGITRFTVRIGAGTILKMCVQVIPLLLAAVLIAAVMIAFPRQWITFSAAAIFLVPPLILLELVLGLFLWMWRQACFIEDIGVVAAFSRSMEFVKNNLIQVILVFVMWIVCSVFISGVFMFLSLLFHTLSQSLMKDGMFLMPFFISLNINLLSWAVGTIVMVFFLFFFYVLYKERLEEEKQSVTVQSDHISLA
ncbi:MAG: hypothetical protein AB1546_11970 [bacterium]